MTAMRRAALLLTIGFTAAQVHAQNETATITTSSGLPGYCATSVSSSGITSSTAQGYADVDAKVPYTLDTVQPVGSVSKTLIGYALSYAVGLKRVDLDDPVRWPGDSPVVNPRFPDIQISWRELATHTSSLLDDPDTYRKAYGEGRKADVTMAAFMTDYLAPDKSRLLRKRFGTWSPGQQLEYSNLGSALVALALEKPLNIDFESFTKTYVFESLGMKSTHWRASPSHTPEEARLYQRDENGVDQLLPEWHLVTWADGGLNSSCNDLSKWLVAILKASRGEKGMLEIEAVQRMLAPQFNNSFQPKGVSDAEPNQGLFWQHKRNGGVGHTGGDPGLAAYIWLDLNANRGKVILTNGDIETSPQALTTFKSVWMGLDSP
jgi:CubicO group peptidase (beta-lactamase class C family)